MDQQKFPYPSGKIEIDIIILKDIDISAKGEHIDTL